MFGVLQYLTSQDVFVPGPSLRILDSTRCQRTPLCHILLLNLDILQGSFRLCNWLSLRRLVSLINHLPPACWSTFRKSNSKQELGCRFDIMDYESYFFCVLTYAIIYVMIHHIIFIRPFEKRTYYAMAMSVRLSVRPSVRPSEFSGLFFNVLWDINLKLGICIQ